MSQALLQVDDIHTYLGDSYIIQGVSLAVPAGKVVALLGRNGAGKTTTLRSIMRMARPRRGRTIRMIERSVVVLPAPLRPSSATTLPAGTASDTPWMM